MNSTNQMGAFIDDLSRTNLCVFHVVHCGMLISIMLVYLNILKEISCKEKSNVRYLRLCFIPVPFLFGGIWGAMVSGLVGAWNSHISHIVVNWRSSQSNSIISGLANKISSTYPTEIPIFIFRHGKTTKTTMVFAILTPLFSPFDRRKWVPKFSTVPQPVAGIASASVVAPSGPAPWRLFQQPWRCQQKLPQARSLGVPSFRG